MLLLKGTFSENLILLNFTRLINSQLTVTRAIKKKKKSQAQVKIWISFFVCMCFKINEKVQEEDNICSFTDVSTRACVCAIYHFGSLQQSDFCRQSSTDFYSGKLLKILVLKTQLLWTREAFCKANASHHHCPCTGLHVDTGARAHRQNTTPLNHVKDKFNIHVDLRVPGWVQKYTAARFHFSASPLWSHYKKCFKNYFLDNIKTSSNQSSCYKKATCYCQICLYKLLCAGSITRFLAFIRTQEILNRTDQIISDGHKLLLGFNKFNFKNPQQ